MQQWDLSCIDWEARIRERGSLVPDLPLIESEAAMGLGFFNEMRLPDQPGLPLLRDAAGPWFVDLVRAIFGSWDPVEGRRYIRDVFALAPKGSAKTSYSAALMLTALLMNKRPRAEALFIGPTQAISDRAFDQAVGMIECSSDLKRRFKVREHVKTIEDRVNEAELKVKTFSLDILTGSILFFALLDEIHLLGKTPAAAKVVRQIRGGIDKTPEGVFLMTTTMPDDIPAGVFRDELINARKVRDGVYRGKVMRPLLPVLYEFPIEIARDRAAWEDPVNWPMVIPNLGRSVHLETLVPDFETEKSKGEQATRIWASQYLNIEIGVGLRSDGWAGAEKWAERADESLDLNEIYDRSEAIVIGLDGGGLDDLFGLCVLGRCRETKTWLSWSHAWCHQSVLERRKTIAARLEGFAGAGELTITDDELVDTSEIVELIDQVNRLDLLAAVAVDAVGLGELVDRLSEIGVVSGEGGQLVAAPQGYGMMTAIKAAERRVTSGTLLHAPSLLMDWCVGNVRIEPTATAIRATKMNAGDAKIDPWIALMNAVTVMMRGPTAKRSISAYESRPLLMV